MKIYRHLPFHEYQSIEGLNYSGLKEFLRSPAHYKEYLNDKPSTPAMEFGKQVHCAILEPESFYKNMLVWPEGDGRNREIKKLRDDLQSIVDANPDKFIIKNEDLRKIEIICQNVRLNADAMALIDSHEKEVSVQVDIEPVRKARFDLVNFEKLSFCDIKTTRDASFGSFMSQFYSLNYDLQAYWYAKILSDDPEEVTYHWIAIENVAPFGVNVLKMEFQSIEKMMKRWHMEVGQAMKRFHVCYTLNQWNSYQGVTNF